MNPSHPAMIRARAIQRVKDRLTRESLPRMQMALIVALTGGFGLLASFTLLHLGMGAMAIRYPLALSIALAFGIALASLYVAYIAPALFAEVLVDGALSYALFRHLRGQDPRHWLASTVRHTAAPFAVTAIFLVAVGAAMAAYAPGAKSVGQVIEHAKQAEKAVAH